MSELDESKILLITGSDAMARIDALASLDNEDLLAIVTAGIQIFFARGYDVCVNLVHERPSKDQVN